MKPHHLLLMLAIDLIWGLNYVAAKIGVTHVPPIWFGMLRFLGVAIVLLPWLRWQRGQMVPVLAFAMFGGALTFGPMFVGFKRADDVAVLAVLTQLSVPFATLLGVIFLRERIGWRRQLGLLLSFGGVVFISFDPKVFTYVDAVVLIVIAQAFGAGGSVLLRYLRGISPFTLQAWLGIIGMPCMLAASLMVEEGQWQATLNASWLVWGTLVFSVLFVTLVAHAGTAWLLRHYPLNVVMPLTLLAPLFGVLFGVVFNGDTLSPRFLAGAAITLAGILIIVLRQPEVAKTEA